MKHVVLTVMFLATVHMIYAQVHFRVGAETGYSLSGKIENDLYKSERDIFETRKVPYSSWVVGLTTDLIFLNHLAIVTGIHFQQKRTDLHAFTIKNSPGPIGAYTMFENYSVRYQKVCIPIGIGFTQTSRPVRFMISGGMRVNFLPKGNLYYQQKLFYASQALVQYNENQFSVIPQSHGNRTRAETQSFVNVSFLFYETVRVAFNYCRGVGISPKYYPRDYLHFTCNNNDYILSVAYMLKKVPGFKRVFYREGHKSVRHL